MYSSDLFTRTPFCSMNGGSMLLVTPNSSFSPSTNVIAFIATTAITTVISFAIWGIIRLVLAFVSLQLGSTHYNRP